jgi:hypothetical protein
MRIPGSQSCGQKIRLAREAKQSVAAHLVEVTVEYGAFLISMDGIVCGVYIDYEPPFVSPSKQGVGASSGRIFECR